MNIEPTTLYNKDSRGAIRQWSIGVEEGVIVIDYGVMDGKMLRIMELVEEGKAGRDLEDQIILRMNSRISKQRDRGYVEKLSRVDGGTNALGLEKPMLAQPLKNVKEIDFSDAFIQHKYDGLRCLITKTEDGMIAYSRNGKEYADTVLDHILGSIDFPKGMTLDGELYCHGETLQTISSWCKRDTPLPETTRVKYHVYDTIADRPFRDRLDMLFDVDYSGKADLAPTRRIKDMDKAMEWFRQSRNNGYEGLILRWGNAGYEVGKRSKSLVKIKEWFDNEYVVVGVSSSKDHWGILTCQLSNNSTFDVSAPGTIEQKRETLVNKHDYIGKKVTVKYATVTKDGIPFHPVAIAWR